MSASTRAILIWAYRWLSKRRKTSSISLERRLSSRFWNTLRHPGVDKIIFPYFAANCRQVIKSERFWAYPLLLKNASHTLMKVSFAWSLSRSCFIPTSATFVFKDFDPFGTVFVRSVSAAEETTREGFLAPGPSSVLEWERFGRLVWAEALVPGVTLVSFFSLGSSENYKIKKTKNYLIW